jgi:beta-phosphoglucomutase family hydrolase
MRFGLPSSVRACLFDLDGVLTPTAKIHAAAWKAAFDPFLEHRAQASGTAFVPFDPLADYERWVDGRPRVDGVRSFLASRQILLPEGGANDPPEADTVHALASRKEEIFVRLLAQGVSAFPGSELYLHAVRDGGLLTAVVSSSRHCKEVLRAAKLTSLFDTIVDGIVAQKLELSGKPAPDTYLEAARELDVAPAEAAVFEDALAGVEAGHAGAFGCVVGVDRVGHAAELYEQGAGIVVSDLAELLKAA